MKSSLIETYEQQFATLAAEITTKIGALPRLPAGSQYQQAQQIERLFEESNDVLEQFELETRNLAVPERSKFETRLKTYRSELGHLKAQLQTTRSQRSELLGGSGSGNGGGLSESHRNVLLENTERLERQANRLDDGYRMTLETEQIGADVLADLGTQREVLTRGRERLRDTDSLLNTSSKTLSRMTQRLLQNRVLLFSICVIMFIVITTTLYFVFAKK